MKIPTLNQWKYQGLAESLAQIIKRNPDLLSQSELMEEFILHAFDKVYVMGQLDSTIVPAVVPVTDLTDIPEIFEHAKRRWRDGLCH